MSPSVATAVERIAADAQRKHLPVDALVQKALEGSAKGIPDERVITAVETLAQRLEISARAVRTVLPAERATAEAATIEAGAFALGTGLGEGEVARLVRASRGTHQPAATLRVAGAVAALGVSAQQTADLMVGLLETGRPMDEINRLPANVQAGLSQGLSPSEAAAGAGKGRGHQGGGVRSQDRQSKKQKEKHGRP